MSSIRSCGVPSPPNGTRIGFAVAMSLGVIVLLFSGGLPPAQCGDVRTGSVSYPFFAFCMDTHDAKKRSLPEQADLLKELGFNGAGHLWLDGIEERMRTLDAVGLTLFQVYMRVNVKPGEQAYDPRLSTVIPSLKDRDVMLALLMQGLPPSDPSGDDRAVQIINEIADMGREAHIRVVLYHHSGDWLERVEDAVRIAEKVNRPEVGVMFNLCHWMKVDEKENMDKVLRTALPHLFAVSISGTDTPAEIRSGKGNWIQPLGSGSYDVTQLMKALRDMGYKGPVGLQCWGIEGDVREPLSKSIAAWRDMLRRLQDP